MGEAAYEDAKAKGELIVPELRELALSQFAPECELLSEAADLIDWLIAELDAYEKAHRDINEALNTGDGAYRP